MHTNLGVSIICLEFSHFCVAPQVLRCSNIPKLTKAVKMPFAMLNAGAKAFVR